MRRMRRMRTERPIVAVKLFNTENRNSVAAAVPVETGTSEPLNEPTKVTLEGLIGALIYQFYK